MSSLRPFPLDNNQSSWLANAGLAINAHNLIAGNGIAINKTANGAIISATVTKQINFLTNKGYYNFSNEYWPGDVIYADPNATYKDQNGAVISDVAFGGYICITYVPPASNDFAYFLSTVVPALTGNGGTATDIIANTFRWYQQNKYYPTGTGSIATTQPVSGYNILTSQSFWQPIGGAGSSVFQYNGNENAAIPAHTFVVVDPYGHYTIPASSSAGNPPPLGFGLYYTLDAVPDSASRDGNSYCHPIAPPLWDDSHVITVSGSTYNKKYFLPLAPMVLVDACINNQTVPGFGEFFASGSSYPYALAHP